jgi:hypothetical protein
LASHSLHREFRHGGGSHEVVKQGEIYQEDGASDWSSNFTTSSWYREPLRSTLFFGTYRGTVVAGTKSEVPEGYGDYEGDRGNAGLAYNGEWRDGVPRGTGWWQEKNEDVRGVFAERDKTERIYAGEFDIYHPCGQGTYWVWRSSGFRCFEGKWQDWFAQGII